MAVIGLDFGNYNSFPCYISDFNAETRIGGHVHDLLPFGQSDGIPSVYFYSKKIGELVGENAVRQRARPLNNRMRYLKRHLSQNRLITEDGETYRVSADKAITMVIEHCVRSANKQLKEGYGVTTSDISLSYPATYTSAQRQRLIELAQNATLEDGRKIKVIGTIAEPAAAALDYLSEFEKESDETTALVYDLGGGTFDLAIVTAYPKGRKNSKGNTYYYDIVKTSGIANVGGVDFDKLLYNILVKKFGITPTPVQKNVLRNTAERTKIELSSEEVSEPTLEMNGDYLEARVTREEFEKASSALLMKTINAMRDMINSYNGRIDYVLLTGGASQMPMVERQVKTSFPQYKDKIKIYRPNRAIAYGAARYGTVEEDRDLSNGSLPTGGMIQKRTEHDIGIRFYYSNSDRQYIDTYIPAGSPLPVESKFSRSTLREASSSSIFHVFEAKKNNPDKHKIDEDYTEIMSVKLEFGELLPKDSENETRLLLDKLGALRVEARRANIPNAAIFENHCTLKNLATSGVEQTDYTVEQTDYTEEW